MRYQKVIVWFIYSSPLYNFMISGASWKLIFWSMDKLNFSQVSHLNLQNTNTSNTKTMYGKMYISPIYFSSYSYTSDKNIIKMHRIYSQKILFALFIHSLWYYGAGTSTFKIWWIIKSSVWKPHLLEICHIKHSWRICEEKVRKRKFEKNRCHSASQKKWKACVTAQSENVPTAFKFVFSRKIHSPFVHKNCISYIRSS